MISNEFGSSCPTAEFDQQELACAREEYDRLRKIYDSINASMNQVAKRIEKVQSRVEASMSFGIEEFLTSGYKSTYKMLGTFFGLGPFNISGTLVGTNQRVINLSVNPNWSLDTLRTVAGLLDAMMEHVKPIDDKKDEDYHGRKYISITTDDLSESGSVYALQNADGTWDLMIDVYRQPRLIAYCQDTVSMLVYMQKNGYTYHLTSFKHGFGIGLFIFYQMTPQLGQFGLESVLFFSRSAFKMAKQFRWKRQPRGPGHRPNKFSSSSIRSKQTGQLMTSSVGFVESSAVVEVSRFRKSSSTFSSKKDIFCHR